MTKKTTPKKIVDRVDDAFYTIANWSIKRRALVAVASLAFFLIGLYFASKVQTDNGIENFFYKQDPAYITYLEYLDEFSSDEIIYLMYDAPSKEHGPFNIEVMRTITKLTETLAQEVPFAGKVTSLSNVEFMRPIGADDIEIDELLTNFPTSQSELLEVKEAVLAKPFYRNYLVDDSAEYAAIIVQMTVSRAEGIDKITYDKSKPGQTHNIYPTVSDLKLREILARPEFANQGITFYISGEAPMNATFHELFINDTVKITGIALLIILLLCIILFRATLAGILGPLTVVIVSVTITIGFLGLVNWKIGNFFSMLPALICAVGVAQAVHIILEFQRQLAISGDRNQAVKKALHKVGGPCLMAALTTATGFATMAVSDLRMIAEFAVYSSIGILATFLFSSTLLVIFLGGKPRKRDANKVNKTPVIKPILTLTDVTIRLNLKYPNRILFIFGTIFFIAAIGLLNLRIDFSFLHELKPHVQWRADTEKIESTMGGTLSMSYLIDTQITDGIKYPDLLRHIEKVQRYAEGNPLVNKTLSIADIIKDLNQTFHSNNTDYHRVPEQQDLLAQYFLVYEMSGGTELNKFVSYDFSKTVIEFQLQTDYASKIGELVDDLDQFIEKNPLPKGQSGQDIQGHKTGIGLLWVKLANHVQKTQITSYTLVFLMIATFMCLSFGSIKVGLLSMIPNCAPILIALGGLGWANVPLDYMKLLLATIVIGIAVDDTIHLVTRFRSRFYTTGNYQRALRLSLHDVGPALIVTSIILVASFSAYLMSSTTTLSNFGLLIGGTISCALLADLFLMPILLMKLKPFGPEFASE